MRWCVISYTGSDSKEKHFLFHYLDSNITGTFIQIYFFISYYLRLAILFLFKGVEKG